MTKLEWCREHAPSALKNLSDEELLLEMDSTYKKYCVTPMTVGDELDALGVGLDTSVLISTTLNPEQVATCLVLGMDISVAKKPTWLFENAKLAYILELWEVCDTEPELSTAKRVAVIARNLFGNKEFKSLTPYERRVVYEMIPRFLFSYTGDKEFDAKKFYERW